MIFRPAHKENNYTVIPNKLLRGGLHNASEQREDTLSPEALGVLVYLLSHKNDWQITNVQLAKFFCITKEKVTKITRELEKAGYAKRVVSRTKGKLKRWDWMVTDERNNFTEIPSIGGLPKQNVSDTQSRTDKNQIKEKPDLVNQPTNNTISKDNNINKEKPEPSLFKSFLQNPPDPISSDAWILWWNYKNINRVPAKATITKTINLMKKLDKTHNLKKCIEHVIERGWSGLPVDKDGKVYESCNDFKKNTLHLVK